MIKMKREKNKRSRKTWNFKNKNKQEKRAIKLWRYIKEWTGM